MTAPLPGTPAEKAALLKALLERQAARHTETHPLSHGQQALWFLHLQHPESAAYNTAVSMRIRSPLDRGALARACQRLMDRHAALRTTYALGPDGPVQIVHGYRRLLVDEVDATGWDEAVLERAVRAAYATPFDLETGSVVRAHLFRIAEADAVFILCIHHIARDGWSVTLLLDEWHRFYAAEAGGTPAALAPVRATYAQHVRREAERLEGPDGARLRQHWREALAGAPTVLELPTDRPRPAVLGARGATVSRELQEDVVARVHAVARAAGATPYTLLLSVFALLLYRYTDQTDLLIGSPALGRDDRAFHEVVGYFVNPVVMRARIRPSESFSALVARMQMEVARALAGQGLPFPLLVRALEPRRDASRSPLVQAFFTHMRISAHRPLEGLLVPGAPDLSVEIGGLRLEPYLVPQEEGQFDLAIDVVERSRAVHVCLKYHVDLFERDTGLRMLGHWSKLLDAVLAHPDRAVDDHDLLDADERAVLIDRWNDTGTHIPDVSIHGLVEAQVARTPDAVAVTDGTVRLTYRVLDGLAADLAMRLRHEAGDGPLTVGLHLEPCAGAVVALLAVLKARATYVPLDPSYPAERLAFMARDAEVRAVITDRPLPMALASEAVVVWLDDVASAVADASFTEAPHRSSGAARDPAYILYTSGSTGTPKGVCVSHASVVSFLCAMQRLLSSSQGDCLLSVTALSFDIVALELLLPLVTGAEVEAGRALAYDPAALRARLERGGVTIMQATPTTWKLLVDAGWQGTSGLTALCGGEALPPALAVALTERASQVWNLYGPTETTIWSTAARVQPGAAPVSIGRPIDNTQVYIVDGHGRPTPVGVPGELLIGGAGVALGYYRRPELTAERFIPDTFRVGEGRRLYRTGDRARWRADGSLEFLGRLDDQVKLNGHRIEVAEVEAAIDTHAAVARAVVVCHRRGDDPPRLVAYWTSRNGDPAQPTIGELRRHVAERLPTAMVPATFVRLNELPRTPNGKIDRLALAGRDAGPRTEHPGAAESADGEIHDAAERAVAQLWRRVLHVDAVRSDDNFFDLGGASIDVLQLVAHARRAGWAMEAADVLRHQTLATLAAALAARPAVFDLLDAPADGVSVPAALIERQAELSRTRANAALAAGRCRTVIESIGVYLPSATWTTEDVVRGCRTPLSVDLVQLTGITARRRAAPNEFSIDLAAAAVAECLARSRRAAADIDLIVCCNISRYDAARRIMFEPGTAARLRARFGLHRARAFDVANACPGTFTALKIVDLFFRTGAARCALVVSGEYITHLTDTAQLEIEDVADPRLACLTVGDSGLALLLEPSPDGTTGFHEIDLLTLGRHSELCIVRPTERPHGGGIMLTDSLALTGVAMREGLTRSLELLDRCGVPAQTFRHFVMHQTSSTTIRNASRELNRLFGRVVCTAENTVDNLAERGNTSTTSHFVALWDGMRSGRVRPGDRVLFSISGSGITLGTALYTMDDLPVRVAEPTPAIMKKPAAAGALATGHASAPDLPRVCIAGYAALPPADPALGDTVAALRVASEACLRAAARSHRDVDLVLYAGVHRTDFICEPATAARLAGALGLGDDEEARAADANAQRVFAFDVFDGALGFLDACHVAVQWLRAGEATSVLVTTAEVDPNRSRTDLPATGIEQGAAAVLLERAQPEGPGFGAFAFASVADAASAATSYCTWDEHGAHLRVERAADLETRYLDAIADIVPDLLHAADLTLDDVDVVLPPHPSTGFALRIAERLGLPSVRVAAVPDAPGDLLTCALPYALHEAARRGLVAPGAIGLLISVGAGLQVGCALYYF